jgi:DedD protein
MWAAGGACLLLLLIWFALGRRNSDTSQKTEVASSESANAIPPQPAVNVPPTTKPATPTAPAHQDPSATPVAPAPPANTLPSRSASSKAEVLPTSAAKNKATTPPASTAPAGNSELVIQVGAMSEEANATKLATMLSTQHFPAFVSKHTTDRFYRVLVGPFPNTASLRETEANLQKSGYQTIEKRFTP